MTHRSTYARPEHEIRRRRLIEAISQGWLPSLSVDGVWRTRLTSSPASAVARRCLLPVIFLNEDAFSAWVHFFTRWLSFSYLSFHSGKDLQREISWCRPLALDAHKKCVEAFHPWAFIGRMVFSGLDTAWIAFASWPLTRRSLPVLEKPTTDVREKARASHSCA